jgi:hypothetical protein
MTLKLWREIAIPHEDVLKGTFQQAEFAADLSRVHTGTAMPEYQNPALFYQRTFITEGMRLLLDSVIKRLAGKGGIRSSSYRPLSAAARRIPCWRFTIWPKVRWRRASCRACRLFWTQRKSRSCPAPA